MTTLGEQRAGFAGKRARIGACSNVALGVPVRSNAIMTFILQHAKDMRSDPSRRAPDPLGKKFVDQSMTRIPVREKLVNVTQKRHGKKRLDKFGSSREVNMREWRVGLVCILRSC